MLKNQLTGQEITKEELSSISALCERQIQLEHARAALEEQLSKTSEELRTLAETTIPDAMMAIGLSEVKLSDGTAVTIKKYYSASISPDNASPALAWLRSSGNGDIIKNSVVCQFGKGEDDIANLLAEELRKKGLHPEQKTFVHPMTLKSFVKERIESAQPIPMDLLGVYVGNKTVIKQPK